MKVSGLVAHKFFGKYHCVMVLEFQSEQDMIDVTNILDVGPCSYCNASGGDSVCEGWRLYPSTRFGAVRELSGDTLDKMIDMLESYGAVRKDITSVASGLAYGKPFSFTIEK